MLKYLLLTVQIIFALNAYAGNCDLKNLNFGIDQAKLKKEFNLNTFDVATEGEGIITVGAPEICKDLPPSSAVRLVLLDNNFVQMNIVNENTNQEILKFAHDTFGIPDNDKKKKNPTVELWSKKNQYHVIYSAYNEGRHKLERLVITSAKHKDLFEQQNKKDGLDMEEEQKNHGHR